MYSARVLLLLALTVELVKCFSWDIVVAEDKQLQFYFNGTLTHTEDIPSANRITSVTYDPVHYRVLFTDFKYPNITISSFDLSTRKIQFLVKSGSLYDYSYPRVVYDPVTQLLFWKDAYNIHSFSLNTASYRKAVDGNLLFKLNSYCRDIALDSCGGYIYLLTDVGIERARFGGSEREVLTASYYRQSLAIDQQTQKMFWTETIRVNYDYQLSIETADFNGENRTTLHVIVTRDIISGYSLAVSKDFVYWKNINQLGIWQLPKNLSQHIEGKLFSMSSSNCEYCQRVAANYTIEEQIQGIKSCENLQCLIPNTSKPTCQYYCFQGNCSVSAEGKPKCSCEAGYSGERCEVNICLKHCLNSGVCSLNEEDEPVCQCTADYEGERCEVSASKDNNCASAEEETKCSCTAGYFGERCEVNACHMYCLNNGVCSLNEEDEAVCECTADYKGLRCDLATTCTGVHADNTSPEVLRDLYSAVKHTLQFYSDKIDNNEAKIQKCEKSITNIKNRCTGLHYHDETTPKTQTSN